MAFQPPAVLDAWLAERGLSVTRREGLGGGCINRVERWHLAGPGPASVVVKTNPQPPAGLFAAEAAGLAALAVSDGPRVPVALAQGPTCLLLEDLRPAAPAPAYWPRLGRALAALHNHHGPAFGFDHDNHIGATPQPNRRCDDGHAFFAAQRLGFQAGLAASRGLLAADDRRRVERLAERLVDLVPAQPPSLLHGDLWSGNLLRDADGGPAIIDPAAHHGWAEAELAMTTLFGSLPAACYDAYEEARPIVVGWRERAPLYNLYHLLNHLNLFGRSYLGSIREILGHYS